MPFWLSVILAGLSVPYTMVIRARNFAYDLGLLPSRVLPVRSVCVGNLTAGGTGKTPAVAWIARFFARRGVSTAIVRRGYRKGRSREASRTPSDETEVLHLQVPEGVRVIENPDRVAAAREAAADGVQLVVLDDGFQHRRARRDLDVVLIDATDPFGGGHVLPWGLLREPVQGLQRAQVVVISRADQVTPAERNALAARLRSLHPGAALVVAVHAPRRLVCAADLARLDLKQLVGKRVRAFAGIAQPEAFFRTLEDLGAHVEVRRSFPDHHDYRRQQVEELLRSPGPTWVTTEKDWVKVRHLMAEPPSLWVLGVELEFVSGRDDLEAALNRVIASGQDGEDTSGHA